MARGGRKYIAVAGNMGVGKSSLVQFLCGHYEVIPFYEPNEANPYLKDFYKSMKRWAFQSQVYFLSRKFRIHQELEQQRDRVTVVQDRTIYEDAEIFASNLYRSRKMNKRDWETYQGLYQTILRSLRPPDLMVYLKGNLRTVRKRIKSRGRPEEQQVPISYLRRLNELYEEWFERYDLSPTLVLETDNMDYATDLIDRLDLLQKIEKYL
ncbi:MAG: deoxynucleoside kinase [Pseudomonadota bacterium]